ncbi:hypothetical protein [Pseudoroseomonas ludipueritiae]
MTRPDVPPGSPWGSGGPWSGPVPLRRGLRQMRGALLVMLALPLAPALLINLIGGSGRQMVGTLLGIGGIVLALRALRGGHGRHRAAILMGVGTGLLALMAAQVPVLGAVIFGAMAWFGTSLLYEGVPDAEPAPAPPPPPAPDPFAAPRARLTALAAGPERLRPAVAGLQELLAEMERQPGALPEARRFLNIQLDGLERIVARLRAGAEPPAALDALVAEMAEGSAMLRSRLRAAESEALDIQIKVLSERLRQEGFA